VNGQAIGQPGVYGTLGTPSPANVPGGRDSAVSWTDIYGNLWLFGGSGYDSTDSSASLDDLWEFNPSTVEWTWMGGGSTEGAYTGEVPGVCGTLGVPSATDIPGGRFGATGWTDSSGNFWLFGGEAFDCSGNSGWLNDLWEYLSATPLLTAEPTFSVPPGTYDTALAVTISDAMPGAAIYYTTDGSAPTMASANYTGALTVSSTQTIEVMATASGRSSSAVAAATYTITGAAMPAAAAPTFSIPAGTYLSEQTVTIADATPGATIFYTTGGTPSLASTVYSSPILLNSTETIQALAVAPGYSASAVARAPIRLPRPGRASGAGSAEAARSLVVTPSMDSVLNLGCTAP
jgi:hypothetical protein